MADDDSSDASPARPHETADAARFHTFVETVEPQLRRALSSAYGVGAGREATADALAWAWENFAKVQTMANPAGYLYRVGQTAAKRHRRIHGRTGPGLHVVSDDAASPTSPWPFEPGLADALARLSPSQRTAVLLIEGWACTQAETAATMGCRISTVRVHHRRGLAKLRHALGVDHG